MTDLPTNESDVFRLLHAYDWHFGKLLGELSRSFVTPLPT